MRIEGEMEIILNYQNTNTFNQLIAELKYALNSLNEKDLLKILLSLSKDSIKDTFRSKKEILIALKNMTSKKINEYRENGVINSLEKDFRTTKDFILNIPDKAKDSVSAFKKLSREEKIELLVSIILGLTIFFVAAGGSDIEGGIPDLDLKLGSIAMHRSIWFHSIIAGFTFEFLLRLAYKIIEIVIEHLPVNHHNLWDRIAEFISRNKNMTISALWLGIAAHLIKDTGLLTGKFKAYADLPVTGLSIEYHKAIMGANGLASSLIGVNNLKNNYVK